MSVGVCQSGECVCACDSEEIRTATTGSLAWGLRVVDSPRKMYLNGGNIVGSIGWIIYFPVRGDCQQVLSHILSMDEQYVGLDSQNSLHAHVLTLTLSFVVTFRGMITTVHYTY